MADIWFKRVSALKSKESPVNTACLFNHGNMIMCYEGGYISSQIIHGVACLKQIKMSACHVFFRKARKSSIRCLYQRSYEVKWGKNSRAGRLVTAFM